MTTITKGKGMFVIKDNTFVETWAVAAAAPDWPVVGIDVSTYQGVMDWEKAKTLIQFAYIRAGLGNDTIDTQFLRNVTECQRLNIPYGLYWYMKPDKDWRKHAASFGQAFENYGGPLPPVFDVEDNGGLNKTALEGWLLKCTNAFEADTGESIAIYTSPGFWNANMPLTNWAKNRALWVANWTSASAPLLPAEWGGANNPRPWLFWQWSANGNGKGHDYGALSVSIDLDRFNGSLADFNARFGVSVPPPVEPPPPVIDPPYVPVKLVRVTATTLNIRAQPSATSTDIGDLKLGSIVPVYRTVGDWHDLGGGWIHKGYTVDA